VLISADYSQIELRVLAHLSQDPGLLAAFRAGEDIHAATAARIFDRPIGEVDPVLRGRAKTVNFGVLYGMGPLRLAREMGIPLAEARAFIEQYFAKMPGVRRYLEENLARARREGVVTTLLGRRRLLPALRGDDARARAQAERIAANTPIQGSAADLIKKAMVVVHERLGARGAATRLILQVHDELLLEGPAAECEEVSDLVRRSMEGAAALDVPLTVEIGWGTTWEAAHAPAGRGAGA
jgi:DNA polymerase-1